MPAPIPDPSRDQQCHHYQAPTGHRCGSPAMNGEYYCYHHLVKNNYKKNHRVLIDPEVTRMEVPPIEDRASIFVALAAVIHRLAENTIDTRRAGQMIYGLQVAMRALDPPRIQRSRTAPTTEPVSRPQPAAACSNKSCHSERAQRAEEPRGSAPARSADATPPQDAPAPRTRPETPHAHAVIESAGDKEAVILNGVKDPCISPAVPPYPRDAVSHAPKTIPITKESLLYFLRSRHCYNCNAELFPAEELTERRHPGAPPEIIEEARPALPAPARSSSAAPLTSDTVSLNAVKDPCISPAGPPSLPEETLATDGLTLNAVASAQTPEPRPQHLKPGSVLPQSTFITPFALHSHRRSVSLRLVQKARHIPAPRTAPPHRI